MADKRTGPGPRPLAEAPPPAEQQQPEQPAENPETQELVRASSPASTALVQRAGTMSTAFAGLVPSSIGEAVLLAGHLTKSTAVPASLRNNPDTMLTVILAGIELGLTPIRAVQSITNISGTLCMKADLQLALAKGRPGVLAFYDEGFERFGATDQNLGKRIQLALKSVKPPVADDRVELTIEKLAAATSELSAGDPYGWAVGIRAGDPTVHLRTFTYADAKRAVIYEKGEDGKGPAEKKPLAEKFNYKSFPGDMYPKRARTRLLQVLAPDVTNGLPAAEAIEGGQVIDAEFTVTHEAPGDDIDTLLAQIRDQDSEKATTIEAAFTQLQMGKAAKLQKLVQFKGKPADLIAWLKDEYAHRKGVDRKRPDVLSDQPAAAEPAKPAAPAQPAAKPAADQPGTTQGEVIDGEVADGDDDHEPGQLTDANATVVRAAEQKAEAAAAAKPMTPAKDLAARFRKGMKTF